MKAERRFPTRCSMKFFSLSPQARITPVRTMRTPHSRRAIPPSRLTMTAVPGFNYILIAAREATMSSRW